YLIRLPKGKGREFDLLKDSVYNPLPKQMEFTPVIIRQSPDTPLADVKPAKTNQPGVGSAKKVKIFYTVKKGDVLGSIADWFDTTPSEIRKWNHLKGNMIQAGKKLTIYIDARKTGYYKRIDTMSAAQKKKLTRKD